MSFPPPPVPIGSRAPTTDQSSAQSPAESTSTSAPSNHSHRDHPHRTLSTDDKQHLESTVTSEKSGKKKDVYKMLFDNELHSSPLSH
ncbi:hypothetical protein HDU99_009590, partial [Rhizoclosmatium hyalinum]